MKKLIVAIILGMYVGCTSCSTYLANREPVEIKVIQEDQTWSLDDWQVILMINTIMENFQDSQNLKGVLMDQLSPQQMPDNWAQCWMDDDGYIHIDIRSDVPMDWLNAILMHEFAHAAVFLSNAEDTSDHGPLWASYYGLLYRKAVGE